MMKVYELEGAWLDYWVAKAEGINVEMLRAKNGSPSIVREPKPGGQWFNFSTDWSQGGPIIERERIDVTAHENGNDWVAQSDSEWRWFVGPTPLIAAMRCFVASKFGEEVPD